MPEHKRESSINSIKPTFELNIGIGSKGHKLFIAANQFYDEEQLVSELTPILNHADSAFDNETGRLRSGSSDHRWFEYVPKWILSNPDKDGIRHRIGLHVPPKLFNTFITELLNHGYRVIPIVSDTSPFKH